MPNYRKTKPAPLRTPPRSPVPQSGLSRHGSFNPSELGSSASPPRRRDSNVSSAIHTPGSFSGSLTASNDDALSTMQSFRTAYQPSIAPSVSGSRHTKKSQQSSKKSKVSDKKAAKLSRLAKSKRRNICMRCLCCCPNCWLTCAFKIPLCCKLLCISIIPIICLLIISIMYIIFISIELANIDSLNVSVNHMKIIADFNYQLGLERALFLNFTASTEPDYQLRLTSSIQTTNNKMEEARKIYDSQLKSFETGSTFHNVITSCLNNLQLIELQRSKMLSGNVTQADLFVFFNVYATTIESCLEPANLKVHSTKSTIIDDRMIIYLMFARFVDLSYQIDSLFSNAIYWNTFISGEHYLFSTITAGKHEQQLQTFLRNAALDQRDLLNEILLRDSSAEAARTMITQAVASPAGNFPFTYADWTGNLTRTFSYMDDLRARLFDNLADRKTKAYDSYTIQVSVVSCIIVIAVILSCCSTCLCQCCIYQPWRVVLKNRDAVIKISMQCADGISRLDFERPAIVKLMHARDQDLSVLELSFKRIVTNFSEFKEYLPQTLIIAVQSIGKEQEGAQKQVDPLAKRISQKTVTQGSSIKGPMKKGKRGSQSPIVDSSFASSRFDRSSGPVARPVGGGGLLALGLQYKDVSLIIFDIQEFHSHLFSTDVNGIAQLHCDILEAFYIIVSSHKGVMHNFIGDKLYISFNAVTTCFDKEKQACLTAIECQNVVKSRLHPMWKDQRLPLVQMNCSIVTGGVYCGTIGSQNMKGFTVFAPMVSKAFAMAKLNKVYFDEGVPFFPILIDETTRSKVDMNFSSCAMDVVKFKIISHTLDYRSEIIYNLCKVYEIKSDEWLYEVQALENQKSPEEELFSKIWDSMRDENKEEAKNFINDLKGRLESGVEGATGLSDPFIALCMQCVEKYFKNDCHPSII